MQLLVNHRTTYLYRRPVALGPHRLVLTARSNSDLRVLESSLVCEPSASLREIEDVFGNKITVATFDGATAELTVTNRMRLDHTASEWPVFRIAAEALTYPFAYSTDDLADLGAMRLPAANEDKDGHVADWAQTFPVRPTTDTLSLLKDLNASIAGLIAYRIRDEEGTQSPAETLALKSGSCRDIAALFVEAARRLGFGARAVSGYLYDPMVDVADPGATHAWAEIYLPEAGWITFDPTHGRVGGAYLIATAVGRRNDQIMPISGSFVGDPDDLLDMSVSVSVTRVM